MYPNFLAVSSRLFSGSSHSIPLLSMGILYALSWDLLCFIATLPLSLADLILVQWLYKFANDFQIYVSSPHIASQHKHFDITKTLQPTISPNQET